MRSRALAASVFLALVLMLSTVFQAYAQRHEYDIAARGANDSKVAEQMVKVAETALFKVESFVNSTAQNANITDKLEASGLMDQFNGNASMLDQAETLVAEAKDALEAGNYAEAVENALRRE